jgi:hypothetical protein
MEITKEIKSTHEHLSLTNVKFLDYARGNPLVLKRSSFKPLERDDKLYQLQSWPTFVNQRRKREISEASINVFELIKKLPQRIFNNDPLEISRYYEMPVNMVKVQLESTNEGHLKNLLGRGDFIFSASGLKCIEYNISVNLGGWQVALWEPLYQQTPVITRFLKENHIEIKNKNLLFTFLEHITNAALETLEPDGKEMNTALVIPGYRRHESQGDKQEFYLNRLYKKLLTLRHKNIKGRVMFCDYHQLRAGNRCVYFKDKRIHSLVETCEGMVPPGIMAVFKAGNIRIYNGPVTGLLVNKLNLALLSENQDAKIFRPDERKIIKKYIPWTRKIIRNETTWQGETVTLPDFILSQREQLVIKPSTGYGGEGVCIGQYFPAARWDALVKRALAEKNWLVQEYVPSSPYYYQYGEEGYAVHGAIWGFFVFGSQYAGGYIRVQPPKPGSGIINCYMGATVSVILEVEK